MPTKPKPRMPKPFKKADEYEVHYSERKIDLGGGLKITMRPMTLKQGAGFMRAVGIIRRAILLRKAPEGEMPLRQVVIDDLDAIVSEQILPLLSYCTDADLDKLPMTAIPILVKAWLDQNMNDEILKNYLALAERVNELSEQVNDTIARSRLREVVTS